MDGNRRWAREHGVEVKKGHEEGARRIEPLVDYAARQGIKYLTFYAFSTENFGRQEDEKSAIFQVFDMMLRDAVVERMMENKVRVNVIGDIDRFPRMIAGSVKKLVKRSAKNDTITANFALNYGGRQEMVQAVKKALSAGEEISEGTISRHLYTAGQPDPELLVRPGGERRLSNFLTWQSVYSELYFVDTLWPDFTPQEFAKALDWYEARQRRFGK